MANTLSVTPPEWLTKQLHSAIEAEISKAIDSEVESAKQRVEKAVRGSVGSIVAKVIERFSFERVDRDLIIRVEFVFPEK